MKPVFERARTYIQKVDPAVSGQGGHLVTFEAATILARGFALPYGEALTLLAEWNTRCSPPWQQKDLERKLRDAYEKSTLQSGYLLGANDLRAGYIPPVKKQPPAPVELPPPISLPQEVISASEALRLLFNQGETVRICRDAKKLHAADFLDRDSLIKQMEAGQLKGGTNGALIGLNPRKANDGTDDGCASFRHMLLECDKLSYSLEQQWACLIASGLPISALIYSGNKSLHAWVRLDAENKTEFNRRAQKIFSFNLLRDFDTATKNAGRLARLPGVSRGDKVQRVVALNIGAESFTEWEKNNTPPESESEQITETQWGFDCLGYNGDSAYFLPHDLAQVAEIPLNKLSKGDALTRIEPDALWWAEMFPHDKGGANYLAAGLDLRARCQAAGVWSDKVASQRLKGRGVWRDAGHIVVNDGTPFLIVDGQRALDRWQSPSGFIYLRGDSLPVALDNPLGDAEAANYSRLMEIQAQNKSAGEVLTGWTVNGFLLGVLEFRPSVWLAGAAEVGKTHTRRLIASALGSFCVDVSANTSEAHLRQSLIGAMPFLFDEAESDDKAGQEAMGKVLAFSRAGAEKDGQTVGKGGQSGSAVSFRVKTCGLFSSIHPYLDRSRDASRFALIELRQLPEGERTLRNAEARRLQRLTVDAPDFSARLAARVIRYAVFVSANTQKLEDCFLSMQASDREAKKWAALVCGSVCLSLSESEWALTDKTADELARGFDFGRFNKTEKDSAAALTRILSYRLPAGSGAIPVTVAELLHKMREQILTPNAAEAERATLAPLGIGLTKQSGLIIQYGHSAMLDLFKGEPWNGKAARVRDDLKQIQGAEVKPQMRVGEIKLPSVVLPLSALDDLLGSPVAPF